MEDTGWESKSLSLCRELIACNCMTGCYTCMYLSIHEFIAAVRCNLEGLLGYLIVRVIRTGWTGN